VDATAESVEAECRVDADEGPVELRLGLGFDEAGGRVEGSVPGDVGIGPQRDLAVPALERMLLSRLEECPPQSPARLGRSYRQLLHVADVSYLQNMHEPGNLVLAELCD